MKKRDSRLRIRIFSCLLIIPTVLWLLLSLTGAAADLDYDTGEKRSKHELSEDTSVSNVTDEVESWYDDRVPFRSVLLSVNSYAAYFAELPYNKIIEPIIRAIANAVLDEDDYPKAAYLTAEKDSDSESSTVSGSFAFGSSSEGSLSDSSSDSSSSDSSTDSSADDEDSSEDKDSTDSKKSSSGEKDSSDSKNSGSSDQDSTDKKDNASSSGSSKLPSAVDSALGQVVVLPETYETPKQSGYYPYKELTADVIRGRDGWLFTTESYDDYTGANIPSDEELKEKMDALAVLDSFCREREIELYTFVMPNKNVVYPEYMPSVAQEEDSAANLFEDLVKENTGINFEYLDEELLGCKAYGQLYYKTDTHWNYRGALAAYSYMRNSLGLSPMDLCSIDYEEGEGYSGDLAQYTGLPGIAFEDEYLVNMKYKENLATEIVRDGEDYIDERITEDAENDQTVVLIGDSFRNSLFPYLSKDYTHAYSLNELKLDEEMMEILKSADVIILESVERNLFSEDYYDNTVAALGAVMQEE